KRQVQNQRRAGGGTVERSDRRVLVSFTAQKSQRLAITGPEIIRLKQCSTTPDVTAILYAQLGPGMTRWDLPMKYPVEGIAGRHDLRLCTDRASAAGQ